MTDRARVRVDLIVIATGEALVTEEVDGLIVHSGDALLGRDVLQAVGLVPASGEDVERYLATNGEAVFHICQYSYVSGGYSQSSGTYLRPQSGNSLFKASTMSPLML